MNNENVYTGPDVRSALTAKARLFHAANNAAEDAKENLKNAVRVSLAHGISEVETAVLSGVTRTTIRAWAGKGKPKRADEEAQVA